MKLTSRVAKQLKTLDLRKLGSPRKLFKPIEHSPMPRPAPPNQHQKKTPEKKKSTNPRCAPPHTKTRASPRHPTSHRRPRRAEF